MKFYFQEEEEKKEKEAEALEFFNKFDKNQDGILSRDELLTVHAFDQNNDGMVNEDEVNFYLSGNESYDQETFLNTGWLLMKNLFSKYEKRPAKNNSKFPFQVVMDRVPKYRFLG